MDHNPYQSPRSLASTGGSQPGWWRWALFAINFSLASLLGINCILVAFSPENHFGTIFVSIFSIPFFCYAAAEWSATVKGKRHVERRLGKANLACAALLVFGLVANISEAVIEQKWPDAEVLFWIVAILGGGATYLAAAGWLRLRLNPTPSKTSTGAWGRSRQA